MQAHPSVGGRAVHRGSRDGGCAHDPSALVPLMAGAPVVSAPIPPRARGPAGSEGPVDRYIGAEVVKRQITGPVPAVIKAARGQGTGVRPHEPCVRGGVIPDTVFALAFVGDYVVNGVMAAWLAPAGPCAGRRDAAVCLVRILMGPHLDL
jgi:hypothetical protein